MVGMIGSFKESLRPSKEETPDAGGGGGLGVDLGRAKLFGLVGEFLAADGGFGH